LFLWARIVVRLPEGLQLRLQRLTWLVTRPIGARHLASAGWWADRRSV
jgi:hypothetical protein